MSMRSWCSGLLEKSVAHLLFPSSPALTTLSGQCCSR
uniref:Uncharacterized protein n=1 Tax=Arundo donax TaxID=35708 RepID=A0A0A9GMZ0_ARUDO